MVKQVPHMVRGLGLAMRLITDLSEEVVSQGGYPEMLHFLTTEEGRPHITKIAGLIVSLPCRVPISRLIEMSREYHRNDDTTHEGHYQFDWQTGVTKFDIPSIRFGMQGLEGGWDFDRVTPTNLILQLVGERAKPGMTVMFEEEEYVVTFILDPPEPGEMIERDHIGLIHLSPRKYFDLEN